MVMVLLAVLVIVGCLVISGGGGGGGVRNDVSCRGCGVAVFCSGFCQ